jgi:hypothetical protein
VSSPAAFAQLFEDGGLKPTLIAAAPIAAFLLAFGVGLAPMSPKARAALVLAGVLGPVIIFLVADPEGDCNYDCEGRGWAELWTALIIASWLIGSGISALVRRPTQGP